MSSEVASSADDIASVMEMAGQLGIANDALTDFTKTMIMLGDSTNMGAGEAAETLARFQNITGMSQKDFEKLGSTLVDLGNNYATTEGEIMTMALRLAGASTQVGMSETDILGLATALSSVGIEAEMGGTALSKAMSKAENATSLSGTKLKKVLNETGISLHDLTIMQKNSSTDFKKLATSLDMTSTELGNLVNAGNDLQNFAEISGMSAEEFTKAWEKDAAGALIKFIQGLGDTSDASENAITMLSEMGITEVRLRDSLVRAANASGLFNRAISDSSKAWSENTALVTEAGRRYETVESQMMMAKNELTQVGIAIYDKFRGKLVSALNSARESIKEFGKQMESKEMTEAIETIADGIGKLVTGLAELAVKIIPKVLTVMSKLIKNWDKIKPLILGAATALLTYRLANSKTITGMTKANALSKTAGILWDVITKKTTLATAAQKLYNLAQAATPWGLIALAIGGVVAGYVALKTATKNAKDGNEAFRDELKKQQEETKKVTDKLEEQKKVYEELDKAKEETIGKGLSEMSHIEDLRNELSLLVDENGKVKSGYETRVGFIIGELNEALGTEISMTNGIINGYKDVQKEIDNLIAKEKAYIVWEAQKPKYEEVIKNETNAMNDWIDATNNVNKKTKFVEDTEAAVQNAYNELEEAAKKLGGLDGKEWAAEELLKYFTVDKNTGVVLQTHDYMKSGLTGDDRDFIDKYLIEYGRQVGNLNSAEMELINAINAQNSSNSTLMDAIQVKTEYEAYAALIAAGEYQKAYDLYKGVGEASAKDDANELKRKADFYANYQALVEKNLEDAKKTNNKALIDAAEAQVKANSNSLQNTMKFLHEQTSTVENTSPEIIEAWKNIAETSSTEYLAYLSNLEPKQQEVIQNLVGITQVEGEDVVNEWRTLTERSLSELTKKNVEFKDAGNGMVQAVIDGKEVGEPQALDAMAQFAADLAQKVKDKKLSAEEAAKLLLDGINNGLSNQHKQQTVLGTMGAFAIKVIKKLTGAWDEHSPSRVSQKAAEYFMEGIGLGIAKNEAPILKEIGTFANELSSTLQSSLGNIRASVNGTVSLGADASSLNEIGQIQSNGGKTVIINQTNNSPKSLSRLEIWRQTNNAAQLAARN